MDSARRLPLPRMFWLGLAVVALGTGPLLALVAIWPGVIMTGAGLVTALDRRKVARRRLRD